MATISVASDGTGHAKSVQRSLHSRPGTQRVALVDGGHRSVPHVQQLQHGDMSDSVCLPTHPPGTRHMHDMSSDWDIDASEGEPQDDIDHDYLHHRWYTCGARRALAIIQEQY
eukprot:2445973-Pyramimonas_sp.AAC.1